MDTATLATLTELASSLTLSVFLLYAWWKEREERVRRTDELVSHYEKHHTDPSVSE